MTPPTGCPVRHGATGVPLYGEEFAADPARVYERLRGEYGSVAPVELAPGVGAMLVTGYDTALQVLRSPETFAKDPRRWHALADGRVPADSPVVPVLGYRPNCLFNDGSQHARLRQAVSDVYDRVDPHALRAYVEHSADVLIDRFAPAGEADLVGEYARLLPTLVSTRLFGCPPESRERLITAMYDIFDGADPESAEADLLECLRELVALKRRRPAADVTSWLATHPSALTDEELVQNLLVLLGAGTEPLQNLIGTGLRLLLSDPRFAGSLSGGTLSVVDALDEILWTDPPLANFAVHYPVRDVVLAGVRLREGEPVVVSLAAANNDPALASPHRMGNRAHLAWSAGPHACAAKQPAHLIAAVALERVLDRLPEVRLAVPESELRWRPGPFVRALTALPVRFPAEQPVDRTGTP
ncbi:cytochrome P450 [Streptomyces sp. NPDC018031]|uniref:cytochrome P450 n=1 Tax=Streptomyces sp. NPDC018031 TaxID=3365033 RepID=UPI00379DDBD4